MELCTLYKLSGDIESIKDGKTSEDAFPFIQCMEINLGEPSLGEYCYNSTMSSYDLSWDTVYQCTQNEELAVQNAAMEATPKVTILLPILFLFDFLGLLSFFLA